MLDVDGDSDGDSDNGFYFCKATVHSCIFSELKKNLIERTETLTKDKTELRKEPRVFCSLCISSF